MKRLMKGSVKAAVLGFAGTIGLAGGVAQATEGYFQYRL